MRRLMQTALGLTSTIVGMSRLFLTPTWRSGGCACSRNLINPPIFWLFTTFAVPIALVRTLLTQALEARSLKASPISASATDVRLRADNEKLHMLYSSGTRLQTTLERQILLSSKLINILLSRDTTSFPVVDVTDWPASRKTAVRPSIKTP